MSPASSVVERLPYTQLVGGSIPSLGTTYGVSSVVVARYAVDVLARVRFPDSPQTMLNLEVNWTAWLTQLAKYLENEETFKTEKLARETPERNASKRRRTRKKSKSNQTQRKSET